MPVIAAKVKCDRCGKTTGKPQPFALLIGGTILCEKCAQQPRHAKRVYTWISPTEQVTATIKAMQLPGFEGSITVMRKEWTIKTLAPGEEIASDKPTFKVIDGPIPVVGYWYTVKGAKNAIRRKWKHHLDAKKREKEAAKEAAEEAKG